MSKVDLYYAELAASALEKASKNITDAQQYLVRSNDALIKNTSMISPVIKEPDPFGNELIKKLSHTQSAIRNRIKEIIAAD